MLGVLSNIQSSVEQIALLEGWSLKQQQQRRQRRPCSPRASQNAKAHLTLNLYSLLLFSNHLEPLRTMWRSLFFRTVFLSWPLRSMFHLALITCESARLPPWLPPSHAERGTETCQQRHHYRVFVFFFLSATHSHADGRDHERAEILNAVQCVIKK